MKGMNQTVFYEGHNYILLEEPIRGMGLLPWVGGLLDLDPDLRSWQKFSPPRYVVREGMFCLENVELAGATEDEFAQLPIFNGISPKGEFYELKLEDGSIINVTDEVRYEGANLLMPITGYVTIGRDLASGYKKYWWTISLYAYEVVFRLELAEGKVVNIQDFSNEAKLKRAIDLNKRRERQNLNPSKKSE